MRRVACKLVHSKLTGITHPSVITNVSCKKTGLILVLHVVLLNKVQRIICLSIFNTTFEKGPTICLHIGELNSSFPKVACWTSSETHEWFGLRANLPKHRHEIYKLLIANQSVKALRYNKRIILIGWLPFQFYCGTNQMNRTY